METGTSPEIAPSPAHREAFIEPHAPVPMTGGADGPRGNHYPGVASAHRLVFGEWDFNGKILHAT